MLAILLANTAIKAQIWVDTLYSATYLNDITYGSSVTFAGIQDTHKLDIGIPVGDTPPICGRPLLMIVHGGAFLAGNRKESILPALVRDFAKRGYVTASIDYRLGMFQTHTSTNCNIPEWNCLNEQDTSEWYRGAYRGAQDLHGAIRFLLSKSDSLGLNIDPRQIFLVGESAGAFICLSAAYMDHPDEKNAPYGALNNVLPPNSIYENACIQSKGFAPNIASMNLARPDLGDPKGTMNNYPPAYRIRGVGSFYGAIFKDLFSQSDSPYPQPGLYIFHNTQDKIVPYKYQRVLAGYAYCAVTLAGCVYVLNRPWCYGGKGMAYMLDTLAANGVTVPPYRFDSAIGNPNCLTQVFDPAQQAHTVDNYWLRTTNMAQFFSTLIDTAPPCLVGISNGLAQLNLTVFPNSTQGWFSIEGLHDPVSVSVVDLSGKSMGEWSNVLKGNRLALPTGISKGLYFVQITGRAGDSVTRKIVIE